MSVKFESSLVTSDATETGTYVVDSSHRKKAPRG